MENRKSFENRLRDKVDPHIFALIMAAYRFAKYGHKGQERDDGRRYFEHPRGVALILIDELQMYDHGMIIAALLHDMIEDSHLLTWEIMDALFGERVCRLVKALTKDKGETFEQYIKRLSAQGKNARTLKLADRLHNVRDLRGCMPKKQKKILEETKEYFLSWAFRTNALLAFKLEQAYIEKMQLLASELYPHPL